MQILNQFQEFELMQIHHLKLQIMQKQRALYKKAYAKMRQRCVTPANIRSAERNAADQIDNLLRSMGFENVKVRFDNTQTQDDIQHGNSQ